MSFFAVLFALLLEQARPLARGNVVHAALRAWARGSLRLLDAGTGASAWMAWSAAVVVPALVCWVVHLVLLHTLGSLASLLWNVAILYVTLGFRQFSHHFTAIRDALDAGEEAHARELLAQWRQIDASELPRTEIIRQVIEHSVIAAHRHVFGVLGWYTVAAAIGLGPAGAVFYRLAEFVGRYWHHRSQVRLEASSPRLEACCGRAWHLIDWLPARVSALGFAVVGSFEEAIDAWRQQVRAHPDDNDGLILAATSGAVNVHLSHGPPHAMPATMAHLRSVVGLVWRSVVLWMSLLALLTLAKLTG